MIRLQKSKDVKGKEIMLQMCSDTEHNFVLAQILVSNQIVHIFCTKCGNSRILTQTEPFQAGERKK